MIFDWLACLPPLAIMWMVALQTKSETGSWMSPPALFCGYWALLGTLHLVIAPDVRVWPPVYFMLLTISLMVYAGARLRNSASAQVHNRSASPSGPPPTYLINSVITFCFAASLFGLAYLISKSPQGFHSLGSPQAFMEMAQYHSTQRYRGHSEPAIFRGAMIFHYFSCFLAGWLMTIDLPMRKKIFALLPVLTGLLVMASLTTKAALLFTLLIMSCAYLASMAATRFSAGTALQQTPISRKTVLASIAAIGALGLIFICVQLVRYEAKSFGESFTMIHRLRLDFFGFLGPISVWAQSFFAQPNDPLLSNLTWGASTFSGPASLFVAAERKTGIFSDAVVIGLGQHSSNIYTVYRSLIADFSLVGLMLFMFFVGYFGRGLHVQLQRGRAFLHPLLAALYLNILWSHITMAFNYNSIVIAWLGYTGFTALALNPNRLPIFIRKMAKL